MPLGPLEQLRTGLQHKVVLVWTLVSSVTRGIWRATDGETGPGDLMVVVIPLGAARAARSSHTRFNPLEVTIPLRFHPSKDVPRSKTGPFPAAYPRAIACGGAYR